MLALTAPGSLGTTGPRAVFSPLPLNASGQLAAARLFAAAGPTAPRDR